MPTSLALALALPLALEVSEPGLRASIEVDASAVGPGALDLEHRIADRGGAALRRADVLPKRTVDDGVIRATVRRLPDGASGYAFEVYAELRGETLAATRQAGRCPDCLPRELVKRITESIEACVPALRERQEAVADPEEEPTPAPPPPVASESKGLGRAGIAGLGLLVPGVAGSAIGAGLLAVAGGRNGLIAGGAAAVTVGGAALITGSALLIVDATRRRKRGRRRRKGSPRRDKGASKSGSSVLVPAVWRRGAGLSLVGRF